ncbi:TrmH family RNA methyltransferase [Candidatus Uhrbacteria bacterium]|nr:TrmH family RNA methyltransferase [Candidatus Uhrbacteria bacterium]
MIVIAHNIRSLHNVGSIFRACDVFGVEKLYLTGITGTPPRKEIAKVALGSEHRVAWERAQDVLDLVAQLRLRGCTILALENGPQTTRIDQFCPIGQNAIILGNEVSGIEAPLLAQCDVTLEIPMIGRKQSLNVSVATGIALFALTRRPS